MAKDRHRFRSQRLNGHGGRAVRVLGQQAYHFHVRAGPDGGRNALEAEALQKRLGEELRVGQRAGAEAQSVIERKAYQKAYRLVVADAEAAVVHMHAELLGQLLLGIRAAHHG